MGVVQDTLGRRTGISVDWGQFTFSLLSWSNLEQIRGKGYTIVHWSHDTEDWRYYETEPKHMLSYIKSAVPNAGEGDGPIILQHEKHDATVEYQAMIIEEISAKGYELVSMQESLGVAPYHT